MVPVPMAAIKSAPNSLNFIASPHVLHACKNPVA
jgi:hypothetical protein